MTRLSFSTVLLILLLFTSPADAAQSSDINRYWSGFRQFWAGVFGSVSGIVGVVLVTGIVGIFIITRGKWLK